MRRVLSCFGLLAVCAWAVTLPAQQLKELDSDVNYDESKIVPYDLPALLISAEGKEIKTPEDWMHVRCPQRAVKSIATLTELSDIAHSQREQNLDRAACSAHSAEKDPRCKTRLADLRVIHRVV